MVAITRFGKLEDAAGNVVDTEPRDVVETWIATDPPSANALSDEARPLITTNLTSALAPVASAAAKTPYVGLAAAPTSR